MSDVKWIKIVADMFEDSKIEFIRSLPEGDSIIVTWMQMLSIAGQSNMGGYLMVTDDIPYSEQFLAAKLKRQPVFLQFALETLVKLKMVNIEDGPYHITNWERYQNIDGLEKIRLQAAERKRKQRERDKLLLSGEMSQKSVTSHVTVTENVTHEVTLCHATELELEKDIKHKQKTKTKTVTQKHEYAEDVFLSEDEHAKLIEKHGDQLTAMALEILSSYKGANGKKYKSDYKAMLNWVFNEAMKRSSPSVPTYNKFKPERPINRKDEELTEEQIQEMKELRLIDEKRIAALKSSGTT